MYRNYAAWCQNALASVPGVAPSNERTLEFMARNALELVSPANCLATNPELLETTRAEEGANLVRGFEYWLEDLKHHARREAVRHRRNSCLDAIWPRRPARS